MMSPRLALRIAALSCILLSGLRPSFAVQKTLTQSAAVMDVPKGKAVARLSSGSAIEQLGIRGDLSSVSVAGWVTRSAFSKVPSLLARVKTLTVTEENAEIRSEPGGGRAIGRLTKDVRPELRDAKGKWVKISFTGFIPLSALTSVRVRITTTLGDIVVELDPARAPKTVENFLSYTRKGTYDGTIFHRVIENFMIQCGGYTETYAPKPTDPPVPIESSNGLKNVRGTVAMARTNDPNSATSQFFINVVDNAFLDFVPGGNPGYTVFGQVVSGMDVADRIRKIPTGAGPAPFTSDVPTTMVVITRVVKE